MCRVAVMCLLGFSTIVSAQTQPAKARIADQKLCREQAQKFFSELPRSNPEASYQIRNHLDRRTNTCYVLLSEFSPETKSSESSIIRDVFDAFEAKNHASFRAIQNGARSSVVECSATAPDGTEKNCDGEGEFFSLIKRFYGL